MPFKAIAALAAAAAFFSIHGAIAQDTGAKPVWCGSEWGANDQIGAANRLTPEMAKRAAGLVTTGKSYALSIETNAKTPAFGDRGIRIVVNQPGTIGAARLGPNGATYNDDFLAGHMGIGTQIDGLGHAGQDHVYYNCNKATDFAQAGGLTKLGIEHIPAIVTRGVLLDMTEYYGQDPVPGGTVFTAKEIEAQAKKQGVTIGTGDVVLFHTGWMKAHLADGKAFLAAEPGLGVDGGQYLVKKGVVAVGADIWGVEVSPGEPGAGAMPVHLLLLAQNGIYIMEYVKTDDLAADDVSEFMFVLGTPHITGLVQGIVTPVAIR
jgi:kynurenine formamidase